MLCVGGKVFDQYLSSLELDIVEGIVCCKDWFFGVVDNHLEEMINSIISLDLSKKDS